MIAREENITPEYDVIIIGGGLAGLVSSILLSRNKFKVLLLEKKSYPFHKVCGEYISNEVMPFLKSIGCNPNELGASQISKLRVSSIKGTNYFAPLEMGGFGISRYTLDNFLAGLARNSRVIIKEQSRANEIIYSKSDFSVSTSLSAYKSPIVLASYGKRDLLDKKLNREFIKKHTRFMAVKYHIRSKYPPDEIGIDNFNGGYCGIAKIENDLYNLCYLYRRKADDNFKTIRELEERVLFNNHNLKNIFLNSEFVSVKPEVINEIYFENKSCISDHIFFCGDSAGLITPICGNGMAMAIHAAKILSEIIIDSVKPGEIITERKRSEMEKRYRLSWQKIFSNRLKWGRRIQKISGNNFVTSASLKIMDSVPLLKKWLIDQTHGSEI